MKKHVDVIIVGGGMVGLAAALALADNNLKVAVVETTPPQAPTQERDLRVIAINPASINFFVQLGIWPALEQQRHCAFDHMKIWVDNSELDFSAAEIDQPELGMIIENAALRHILWQQAEQQSNIDLIITKTLPQVNITNSVELTLDQQSLTSQLIIGADGVNSNLRQQLKFAVNKKDYQHHALVTRAHTEHAHQHTAWQHFLTSGPLAFLPLDDEHQCSIVWSSSAAEIETLKDLSDADFNQALGQAFQHRLGKVKVSATRVSFPLQRQHLVNYVAPHVAFIGDAAHRIHPLAGQGANLGFMDAQCLAAVLKTATTKQQALGSLRVLQRYQRERKYDNQKMLFAMDFLKSTFASQQPVFSTLRNIGIDTLQKHRYLKTFFSQAAS